MKKIYTYGLIILLVSAIISDALAQVKLIINQYPENTPLEDDIYVAGSFNNWQPREVNYRLNKTDNYYTIQLNLTSNFEYKFTRGSWTAVEGGPEGSEISNRSYSGNAAEDTVYITIESWKDLEGSNTDTGQSTKAENVHILEGFNMTPLERERRVWVYLPPNYESTDKTFSVLYMHDGQNVFDQSTSFSGEWGVDEALNAMYDSTGFELIVVAVDNGEALRIDEYSPWVNAQYGGGEGELYTRFLVETLKPYIEENYRVSTDPSNIGVMGSSLGGHISFYAGMKYPDEFTKLGVLSPAFWINPEIYEMDIDLNDLADHKIYIQVGGNEGDSFISSVDAMVPKLKTAGLIENQDFINELVADGAHSEWFWRREFPKIVDWLFKKKDDAVITGLDLPTWAIQHQHLSVEPTNGTLTIYDLSGKPSLKTDLTQAAKIPLTQLPKGLLIMEIKTEHNRVVNKLLIK